MKCFTSLVSVTFSAGRIRDHVQYHMTSHNGITKAFYMLMFFLINMHESIVSTAHSNRNDVIIHWATWTEKTHILRDNCESVKDVMMTHLHCHIHCPVTILCWLMPTHSKSCKSNSALRCSTVLLYILRRLICRQLSRLSIKPEPFLKVKAVAAWLFSPIISKQRASVHCRRQ